jgi:Uma2 family endonuclease
MASVQSITTAEQLLKAGDIGRCELVQGELIMMSLAGANHGQIANSVAYVLTDHVERQKLGSVFAAETGFLISRDPDSVRAPDVAFVKVERLHLVPQRGYFPGAPDLAVEVLSPDDPASDVMAKVQDWLDAGTSAVWIVDPQCKTVTIHRRGAAVQMLRESDDLTADDLLPGFRVPVVEVFR